MSAVSLADIIAAAEAGATHLRVCTAEEIGELTDRFGTRNVTVEHTTLPREAGEGFVVVTRDDEFVGAVGVAALRTLLAPPARSLGTEGDEAFQALLGLLDDTVFTSLDRRQLLATSREIEDRAWRLGRGRLYAGFQSFSAMRDQVEVYERLASKAGLEVHVFGEPDWEPPAMEGVIRHATADPEITRVWFVVYDGADSLDDCALLAEERSPGQFHGFWTYEPDRVREIVAEVERVVAADGS